MTLQEEIKAIEAGGYKESARILNAFISKPKARMFVSITQFVDKVCEEVDDLSSKKGSVLQAEEKVFERVTAMIKAFSDFIVVFETGEKMIADGQIKQEEASDFLTKQAQRRANGDSKQGQE